VPAKIEVLESLVSAGEIRYYGWSIDPIEENAQAIQFGLLTLEQMK
jgi:aryl-alcohol dehydrogenase-like predicted oxidoreductase